MTVGALARQFAVAVEVAVARAGGSRSATVRCVDVIPQKELRNHIGEVLRRVEAGESLTVTVAGRPVAELRPTGRRRWVGGTVLAQVWAGPQPRELEGDLAMLDAALVDPFDS